MTNRVTNTKFNQSGSKYFLSAVCSSPFFSHVSFYLHRHHSFLMCESIFNHCSSSLTSWQAFALHHLHRSTSSPLLWFVTALTGTNHMKSDFLPRSDHAVVAHTVSQFYGSFNQEETLIAVSRRPTAVIFLLPLECSRSKRAQFPVFIGL